MSKPKGRKSKAYWEAEAKYKEFEKILMKKWENGTVVNMISGGERVDKEVELIQYEPKKAVVGNKQVSGIRKSE